jgi:hypothetical protein
MAVRASMSDLITRVRLLCGDPASASAQFTDQTVQDWLDRTQQLVRYELETAAPDIVPQTNAPAAFNWATYVSRYTDWEADAVFQCGTKNGQNWAIITPLTADYQRGVWTFDVTLPTISTSIPAQLPPVFILGKVYDPYLAAAELLELWAASLASTTYNFTSDGQSFSRGSILDNKLKLANLYRRQAKPRTVQAVRSDLQASTSIQPVRLIGETNDFGG